MSYTAKNVGECERSDGPWGGPPKRSCDPNNLTVGGLGAMLGALTGSAGGAAGDLFGSYTQKRIAEKSLKFEERMALREMESRDKQRRQQGFWIEGMSTFVWWGMALAGGLVLLKLGSK